MNKTEMIEAVASETGLAKTEVAKVLNAYTDTIVKTVAEDIAETRRLPCRIAVCASILFEKSYFLAFFLELCVLHLYYADGDQARIAGYSRLK